MGSDVAEIDRTVAEWQDRLIDESYRPVFRDWLMKEHPNHQVAVSAFAILRTPVTNGDYAVFLDTQPRAAPRSIEHGMPANHPV